MPTDPSITDADLMVRVQRRDESALALLYDRYGKVAYSVAYHVLQNSTLAEEATQDAFLKVWNQAHLWDGNRGKPSTWLLTITRFTAIDRLRVENRRAASHAVDLDDVLYTLGTIAPMDEPTWADERLAKSLLNHLPPDQRQVLELAYFRDMSHSEMAEYLAIPLGTVKGRVRAALHKLRDLWAEQTEDSAE
ncbi:MAG: sigma-70 family RNA polymerase sigma factor [Chloroflexi bacterium]|nr:sigma-70 family RNA polymerase sigma factor [Chloroflexota bacterium]